MTVINSNTAALRAQNGSRMANQALQTAMERLSTGKRINSAKDDAAGLAISSSMTSQIRGMSQAIRNANDGISLAQTADGALGEVTNMLQRIRELSVQSASGTYSDDDRANLQSEVAELGAQIDTIVANTKFNGVTVFGSSDVTVDIQTGSGSSDQTTLTITALERLRRHRVEHFDRWRRHHGARRCRHRAEGGRLDPRLFGRRPEPPRVGRQQPDQPGGQPVRRAVADRGRRFLGRIDQPRQGADPEPGIDRDAGPGEPEPVERAEPASLSHHVK